MRDTKFIREQLGLTQRQLADYLCIKRGTLAMAECGKRPLPGKALLKLANLIGSLPLNENKSKRPSHLLKETQKQNEKARIKLEAHAAKCMVRIVLLERKLEKLKSAFNKGQEQMKSLSIDQDRNDLSNKIWFEVMQLEALKKIERSSIQDQVFLELRIAVLKFESQCALEMAENLSLINR